MAVISYLSLSFKYFLYIKTVLKSTTLENQHLAEEITEIAVKTQVPSTRGLQRHKALAPSLTTLAGNSCTAPGGFLSLSSWQNVTPPEMGQLLVPGLTAKSALASTKQLLRAQPTPLCHLEVAGPDPHSAKASPRPCSFQNGHPESKATWSCPPWTPRLLSFPRNPVFPSLQRTIRTSCPNWTRPGSYIFYFFFYFSIFLNIVRNNISLIPTTHSKRKMTLILRLGS